MITWDRVDELVTHARVTGSGYSRVNCPACWERHGSPDHKASLSANRETGWWKCHQIGRASCRERVYRFV